MTEEVEFDPRVEGWEARQPKTTEVVQEHKDAMRRWQFAVSILPAGNLDNPPGPRGLWTACCTHPDHKEVWTSSPHNAGTAAVALKMHWEAKHGA